MPDTYIGDEERGLEPDSRALNRSAELEKAPGIFERVKEWFEDPDTKEQRAAENLSKKLSQAKQLAEGLSNVVGDKEVAEKLNTAGEYLGKLSEGLEKGVEIKGKVGKALAFIDAVNAVSKIDIANPNNSMKAAKAFDEMFSAAGELEDLVPEAFKGPWSVWFTFFKDWGNFLSDVSRDLIPTERESFRRLLDPKTLKSYGEDT
jgi:hypothetical protein